MDLLDAIIQVRIALCPCRIGNWVHALKYNETSKAIFAHCKIDLLHDLNVNISWKFCHVQLSLTFISYVYELPMAHARQFLHLYLCSFVRGNKTFA